MTEHSEDIGLEWALANWNCPREDRCPMRNDLTVQMHAQAAHYRNIDVDRALRKALAANIDVDRAIRKAIATYRGEGVE